MDSQFQFVLGHSQDFNPEFPEVLSGQGLGNVVGGAGSLQIEFGNTAGEGPHIYRFGAANAVLEGKFEVVEISERLNVVNDKVDSHPGG
jgi:hypothetical protein